MSKRVAKGMEGWFVSNEGNIRIREARERDQWRMRVEGYIQYCSVETKLQKKFR